MKPRILIVDDEVSICLFLSLALESHYTVDSAASAAEALQKLKEEPARLVLLDLMLGSEDGLALLKEIRSRYPETGVIMLTAYGSIETSLSAMKLGAFSYLCKPVNIEELQIHIGQALAFQSLSERVEELSCQLEVRYHYGQMIGKSPQMQRLYQLIEKLKDVDTSVLITGESGSGKELVARAIHYSGHRRKGNFLTVNCAASPEGLLEEEFFGHKKGAFTGAVSDKPGKLALANGGTLFLDEVGDMPLALQGKLLRAIQEKEYSPIGSNELHKIDIRILSATNRNLRQMVEEGRFRQDLFYRLRVFEINLPPLRSRRQDIPLLCQEFLRQYNGEHKKNLEGIAPQAEKILLNYDYPGNVRELANAVEYAVILAEGPFIQPADLPAEFELSKSFSSAAPGQSPQEIVSAYLTGIPMREMERLLIQANLAAVKGKRKDCAAVLGISERSLLYKLREYGLS